MSILDHKKQDDAVGDEFDAFVEFFRAQDPDGGQDLQDHIRRRRDLLFMHSKPLRENDQEAKTDPPSGGQAMPPARVSEFSSQTKKAVQKARPGRISTVLKAATLIAFWMLLLSIAIRFFEFPFNYVLGAAFVAPVVLGLVPLLRNVRLYKPR